MAETAPHVVIACVRANWQLEPIGKHERTESVRLCVSVSVCVCVCVCVCLCASVDAMCFCMSNQIWHQDIQIPRSIVCLTL